MRNISSTHVAMETQDQLKPSEETVHLKVLKLMHFSNSNVKSYVIPASSIPQHYQNLYSSSGLGSYSFLHFFMWH